MMQSRDEKHKMAASTSSIQLQAKASSKLPKSGQKRRKKSSEVATAKRKRETGADAAVKELKSTEDAVDMSKWEELGAPAPVVMALRDLKFSEPTAIQSSSIPPALVEGKDIIGAAETGSGKTLAYGIPILAKILSVLRGRTETVSLKGKRVKKKKVKDEQSKGEEIIDLNQVLHSLPKERVPDAGLGQQEEGGAYGNHDNSETSEDEMDKAVGTCVYVRDDIPADEFERMLGEVDGEVAMATDVAKGGGMKEGEENDSLLSLVVVPTRELALQVQDHLEKAAKYTRIKVVGLVGGMALPKQERQLRLHPHVVVATPGRLWKFMSEGNEFLSDFGHLQTFVLDEADRMVEHGHFHELKQILKQLERGSVDGMGWGLVQKFIFSATLTMEKEKRGKGRKKDKKKATKDALPAEKGSIEELITMVGIKKDQSVTIDLTSQQLLVRTLTEAKITCGEEDKDIYLIYFLSTYPGRTLVFVNTIDHLKRLQSLLILLGCQPHCLHAGMQQRQRLKNLERFTASEQGLLLASDVAARGLDIHKVQHVIHYHVPMNSDVYVHRSGRTARAQEEGLSVMLVGPKDLKYYRQICRQLNKDQDLPLFPVEARYLPVCRSRVQLAHRIERTQRRLSRDKKADSWLVRSAKALDVDLDDDLLSSDVAPQSKQKARELANLESWKEELKVLLKQPILPKGFSPSFPTLDDQHMKLGLVQNIKQAATVAGIPKPNALEVVKKKGAGKKKNALY